MRFIMPELSLALIMIDGALAGLGVGDQQRVEALVAPVVAELQRRPAALTGPGRAR